MLGPLLPPVAHLPLDDPGVDPVPTLLQDFLGHLRHQILIPPAEAPVGSPDTRATDTAGSSTSP